MEEVKNKTIKKTSNTSKVRKVSKTKNNVSELSSDELMEQILAKKKNKNNSSAKSKSISSAKKSSSKSAKSSKTNSLNNDISNDELYDLIKSKKKNSKRKVKVEDIQLKEIDISINDSHIVTNVISDGNDNIVEDVKVEGSFVDKENLIITREIVFSEDKLDLKDTKVLEELRDAIKEFDALDDTAEIPKQGEVNLLDDDDNLFSEKVTRERKYKNKASFKLNRVGDIVRLYWKKIVFLSVFICLGIIGVCFFVNKDGFSNSLKVKVEEEQELVVDVRTQLYEECLVRPIDENDYTEELQLVEQELTNYLKDNYNTSVIYEDLNLAFSYSYNSDVVYYAASTIKTLDALYIYTKAAAGELNLDETMKYTQNYKWPSSKEMSKHKYGDEITLRDLVKYTVTVSDNSAHQMLVSYIGRSNLKEYGLSLGAENTLVGGDNFGNISANDAIIYMKELNKFINNNQELGKELQSYFLEAEQNDLAIEELNIQAAHKYGEYSYYYHDIGIVYDENPYVIAILTTEGKGDFEAKVRDINKHVYELHRLYNDNRKNVCYLEVYGN